MFTSYRVATGPAEFHTAAGRDRATAERKAATFSRWNGEEWRAVLVISGRGAGAYPLPAFVLVNGRPA